MGSENGHLVSQGLQSNSGIDDESFSAADAQVWVYEDNILTI